MGSQQQGREHGSGRLQLVSTFLFSTDIHAYAKDEPKLHDSHAFGCLLILATAFINCVFFFFLIRNGPKKNDTSFFSSLLLFFLLFAILITASVLKTTTGKKKTHEKQLPSFSYFSYKLLFFRRYKKDAHTQKKRNGKKN